MKIKIILLVCLSITAILIGFFLVSSPWPGSDVEIQEITKGEIGAFKIGDSKAEVLNKNQMLKISSRIKGCKNWLPASSKKLDVERCFIPSDNWGLSNVGFEFCPKNRDWHADAYFKNNQLIKLKLRCTYPI